MRWIWSHTQKNLSLNNSKCYYTQAGCWIPQRVLRGQLNDSAELIWHAGTGRRDSPIPPSSLSLDACSHNSRNPHVSPALPVSQRLLRSSVPGNAPDIVASQISSPEILLQHQILPLA